MFAVKSSRAAILGIAFVVASSAEVMSQDKLSDDDQEWLEEEVAALITAEEVEIFQSLQSGDRKLFKDIFWARRDLEPMTPQNEFTDWYKERVAAADEAITQARGKGSQSDMGEIFILFGRPTEVGQRDQTVTWAYSANLLLGIPDGHTFEFRESPVGHHLVRNDETEAILERAKVYYVANRALSYVRDEDGRLQKPAAKFDPNSPTKKMLQDLIANKTESVAIPFLARSFFFRASEGAVYIPILFEINPDALSWEGDQTKLTIFGAVENAEGQVLYPFDEPVVLKKNDAGLVVYDVPIEVSPGTYTLCLGVMDNQSSQVGTRVLQVEAPDLTGEGVKMSSVLLYSEGRQVTELAGTPGHAFQFGPIQFIPKTGDVLSFTRDGALGILYFVYGLGSNASGQPSVTGQYVFYYNGDPKGQTPVEPLQATTEHAIGNAEIPLSGFQPGNYRVQIKVIDQVTQKTVTQDVEFVLE